MVKVGDNQSIGILSHAQAISLRKLCEKYNVPFNAEDYTHQFDLPKMWVGGWIGGMEHRKLYVGCSPEGEINS